VDQELIAGIAGRVGPHAYLLDPHGPTEGPVDRRWRIRENIDVMGEL
jgi:predicted transcriptional regulator of viral defense system